MNYLKYVLSIFFCFLLLSAHAQEEVFYKNYYDDFKPLRSVGDVPKVFTNPTLRKRKKNSSSKKSRKKSKKENKPVVTTSAEQKKVMKSFLQSGHVIFGDTISKYLNTVLRSIVEPIVENELLSENELDIIEDVQVYPIRSEVATSFTSHDGVILISMGLISHLENEAQLAYLLSTEIARFLKYSRVSIAPTKSDPALSASEFISLHNVSERLVGLPLYSTVQHVRADTTALRIYDTTNYSGEAPSQLLAIYERVNYPYKNIQFDPAWISVAGMTIDESELLARTAPIKLNEYNSKEDVYSELPLRMVKVANEVDSLFRASGEKYIIGKGAFDEVQKQARFDIGNLLIKAEKYEEAIYHNFLLAQDYESFKYPRLNTAFALSRIAKYKNNSEINRTIESDKVQGRSQQVHHLMENYDAEELTVLANRYAWDIWMTEQKDEKLTDLIHDNFFELTNYIDDYSAFIDTSENSSEWEPIFTDIVKHELHRLFFKKSFEKALIDKEAYNDKVETAYKDSVALTLIREKQRNKYKREIGFGLNKSRLLVVTPPHQDMYIEDSEDDDAVQKTDWYTEYEAKKDRSQDVYNVTKKVIKKLKMRASYLNSLKYLKTHVGKFNNLSAINDFTQELLSFNGLPVASYYRDEINDIIIEYEKDDLAIIGATAVETKLSEANTSYLSGLVAFPLLSPYFGYKAFQKRYDSYVYAMVIDLKEAEVIFDESRLYRAKNDKMNLSQQLYDLLYHVKNPPKRR